VRLNLKTKTQKLKQGVLKMIRLAMATFGIILCLRMMSQPTDPLTFGVCGLFLPIFFFYGYLAIKNMPDDKEE
jgi:hypothetical protein